MPLLIPIPCTMAGPVNASDQVIMIQNMQSSCPAPMVTMIPLPSGEALKSLGVVCHASDSTGSFYIYGNGPSADTMCENGGLVNEKVLQDMADGK
jgi:hypothetical protein